MDNIYTSNAQMFSKPNLIRRCTAGDISVSKSAGFKGRIDFATGLIYYLNITYLVENKPILSYISGSTLHIALLTITDAGATVLHEISHSLSLSGDQLYEISYDNSHIGLVVHGGAGTEIVLITQSNDTISIVGSYFTSNVDYGYCVRLPNTDTLMIAGHDNSKDICNVNLGVEVFSWNGSTFSYIDFAGYEIGNGQIGQTDYGPLVAIDSRTAYLTYLNYDGSHSGCTSDTGDDDYVKDVSIHYSASEGIVYEPVQSLFYFADDFYAYNLDFYNTSIIRDDHRFSVIHFETPRTFNSDEIHLAVVSSDYRQTDYTGGTICSGLARNYMSLLSSGSYDAELTYENRTVATPNEIDFFCVNRDYNDGSNIVYMYWFQINFDGIDATRQFSVQDNNNITFLGQTYIHENEDADKFTIGKIAHNSVMTAVLDYEGGVYYVRFNQITI